MQENRSWQSIASSSYDSSSRPISAEMQAAVEKGKRALQAASPLPTRKLGASKTPDTAPPLSKPDDRR